MDVIQWSVLGTWLDEYIRAVTEVRIVNPFIVTVNLRFLDALIGGGDVH